MVVDLDLGLLAPSFDADVITEVFLAGLGLACALDFGLTALVIIVFAMDLSASDDTLGACRDVTASVSG